MKKNNLYLLTVVLASSLMFMTGCQSEQKQPAASEKEAEVTTEAATAKETSNDLEFPLTLRVGYSTGSEDPRGIALSGFKETVETQTGGDILIDIYPSGELGSDSELIAGMITKDVDMTVSSAGNYALYATRVGVSALPFLFEDFESAWEFIDSDMIQKVDDELESYNIHVLAYFDNGFRCVTTSENIGPVEKVEDMEGLNIRTPENQIVMETMSALKAKPKSYPFAELKQALENGTFDAQENPIPVIYNNQLYEVQKYLSVTNHSYDAMPLTIRQDIWDKLPLNYRNTLQTAATAAEKKNRLLVKQQTEEFVNELENVGMEIVYPDLQPFREAAADVLEMFRTVYGEKLISFVTDYTNSSD